jgi:hypothetical protein
MDTVAQPISAVIRQFESQQISYTVTRTRPSRNIFDITDDCLYVVRQTLDDSGVYHITVAAKMGKEVF